jgi:hypothetical protein
MAQELRQLWPIFICYRRVDGAAVARRLHEMLDKWETSGPDGTPVQLDVYLDETMPGVADWKQLHQPYLQKARALLLVCTPGAKIDEGPGDWVHREIDWWLAHRQTAPILIDALKEGVRYVPDQVVARWPDIQRIAVVEEEWRALSGAALEEKTDAVRRQVIGALLPSGAAVYVQELEAERQRARHLRRALVGSLVLLGATALAGGYAYVKRQAALRSERIAGASLLDAQAAGLFAQSRLVEARQEVETIRRGDLLTRIGSLENADPSADRGGDAATERPEPRGGRLGNLRHELAQLDQEVLRLRSEATALRSRGRELLGRADAAWADLADDADQRQALARSRPQPPHVLSVELINAGAGESILVHYGTPDDIRLVMINGGPRRTYRQFVERRLREIQQGRFGGRPVPIERFVVGDQDADKTQGLLRILEHLAETEDPGQRLVELRGIWANLFRVEGRRGLRPRLRALIDELELPLNEPFDHLVMRPDRGRAVVTLERGLEIVVLGPERGRVHELYEMTRGDVLRFEGSIEDWPEEGFSKIQVSHQPAPLTTPSARGCERYQMFFVNRDGEDDAHGARLDAFFRDELPYHPSYRRIFRSAERGSVIVDLLDPVRY